MVRWAVTAVIYAFTRHPQPRRNALRRPKPVGDPLPRPCRLARSDAFMSVPMPRDEPAIELDGLVKVYNTTRAVDGISFALSDGSITGLLGGNGAGKTTTLAMILGLVQPSAGTVKVLGAEMPRQRYQVLHKMNFESPY